MEYQVIAASFTHQVRKEEVKDVPVDNAMQSYR